MDIAIGYCCRWNQRELKLINIIAPLSPPHPDVITTSSPQHTGMAAAAVAADPCDSHRRH